MYLFLFFHDYASIKINNTIGTLMLNRALYKMRSEFKLLDFNYPLTDNPRSKIQIRSINGSATILLFIQIFQSILRDQEKIQYIK